MLKSTIDNSVTRFSEIIAMNTVYITFIMLISIISRSSQGLNYNNSLAIGRTAMENSTLNGSTQDGNQIDTLDTKNATEKRKFDKLWPQYRLLVENAIKNKSITKKQFTKYIERLRYVRKVYPNKAIYWLLEMQNAILKQKRLFPPKEREISVLYLGLVQTQDWEYWAKQRKC